MSSLYYLKGSVLVLVQFDVCEEVRLVLLRRAVRTRTIEQPSTKHSIPAYVRYQRPPVLEPLEPLFLESGEHLEGEIKFYDYGVVSLTIHRTFTCDWDEFNSSCLAVAMGS